MTYPFSFREVSTDESGSGSGLEGNTAFERMNAEAAEMPSRRILRRSRRHAERPCPDRSSVLVLACLNSSPFFELRRVERVLIDVGERLGIVPGAENRDGVILQVIR